MEGVDVLVEVEGESKMIRNKRGRGDDGEITTRLEKRPSGMMMVNQVFNDFDYSGDEMINGVKYEEEKDTTLTPTPSPGIGTGLFNQLITNLVNSPESKLQTHDDDDDSKKNDHVGDGEGGGVINKFISNIFTGNNNGIEVVVEEKDSVVDAAPAQVVDDGQNEDDGVIDNIVAQLPRTLSAPATDEASILIHSIIHD